MDLLPAHLNRDSFRYSFKGLVALEIIIDLPIGFPINNIISLDRDKMILFSFIKHVILGKMNKETQNGPTQHTGKVGLEPPTPHKDTTSREHPAEPETEIGAACFEPGTALLLQNPLNQDTYDPDQALSRPIGSMKYGDTALAERHGSYGQCTYFY